MIRDPSDGSVRTVDQTGPISSTRTEIDNPGKALLASTTSGLPITKAKAEYLERLEESRKWLKSYVRPTIKA